MKCVRCGNSTTSKTSFCKGCRDFLKNRDNVIEENNDDDLIIKWGYMMVTFSVLAVAVMLAMIVFM